VSSAVVSYVVNNGPRPVADERERAWHDSLREAGLDTRHLLRTSWSAHGGFEAAANLLAEHGAVTQAFVTSDQQAIGVIAGLHHAGRSVPTDSRSHLSTGHPMRSSPSPR
jgi:DNA-binding LacI/PurR family transcriptional regulator